MQSYDVLIIGAGVTGCAVARYMAKYNAKTALIERGEDVCAMGASKANSAIVHAGFDAKHGSLMAKMNVEGCAMMAGLAKELDFHYENCGSLVVCMEEADLGSLYALYENGVKNGVKGLEIIKGERLFKLEPNLKKSAVAALYAPSAGIVCPFGLTYALAENAAANGVEFLFDKKVTNIRKIGENWVVDCGGESYIAKVVINAAGAFADELNNMVSAKKLHITPRKGEYMLLDKNAGGFVKHTVFQLPTKLGKGVLVSPTVHDNIIVGPTATDIEDKDGTNTTRLGLDEVKTKACLALEGLPLKQVITSFGGIRAHEDGHEFILGECEDAQGFFNCAGIESPGLTSAPAIGGFTAEAVAKSLGLREKADFIPTRKGIVDPRKLSIEMRNALVEKEPAYGRIVCRCEGISEGEIKDALHRTPGARSLDGVKRRVRAGMGRCQGGFCSPKVMEIIAKELNLPISTVTKSGGGARLVVGENMNDRGVPRL